jgi:uncharacterized lipoprotein YajG
VELDQLVWSSRTVAVTGNDNRKKAAVAKMTIPNRLILHAPTERNATEFMFS